MRIAYITNFCPHYRVKTYETLSRYFDIEFFFYSAGDEWYWQKAHGVQAGNFKNQYLSGFRLGNTRITPKLPVHLWKGGYDIYIKCINGRFALPVTYLVARLRGKPFILWTGLWARMQTPMHRLMYPLTRYIYQHADAIVAYGSHVKDFLIEEGVPAERIFYGTHSVDNEQYAREVSEQELQTLREQLQITPDQRVILYFGRLEEVKGLPYLLEAFASLQRSDAVLVFAGAGAEEARLRVQAEQLNITDRVRFAGYVPVKEAVPYYALSWTLVLNSITVPQGKETWGLVINEAFNQGTPAIASDAVGAAAGGLVRDGETGLVVPERNVPALAQAIQRMLDEPGLRERLSARAREVIATWDNEAMVMGFRQAIEYVTTKRNPQS
jgi:glycosyltransferase involved in cell wall biosynthesis